MITKEICKKNDVFLMQIKGVRIAVFLFFFIAFTNYNQTLAQKDSTGRLMDTSNNHIILPGSYQMNEYLPLLIGKRIGVLSNHTSLVGQTLLIDTLLSHHIQVVKLFSPEHGFRGLVANGDTINDYVDSITKIPVVSLYNSKKAPSETDLDNIDMLVYDIQDIGVRTYTYISSLELFIKAAIKHHIPIIILDRPNPNGFYVDGPILDTNCRSFVGMQKIPLVYGMTIGEYAQMLIGENLIQEDTNNLKNASLTIIPCKHYTHQSYYLLPTPPSPNLPDMQSVYLYPSSCLFEGTVLSEGRGTVHPFCYIGHPSYSDTLFHFTPVSTTGSKHPKFENEICYGWNFYQNNLDSLRKQLNRQIQLQPLLRAYQFFKDKPNFFRKDTTAEDIRLPFFDKIAGNRDLMYQLKQEYPEPFIRVTWKEELDSFMHIRAKYLLYDDFTKE
ncbi:MAG: DUF1343 domain-containing protein [Phycisphaerales bacterium]|nr:DUF1343 domain-containing protein [Phycisphaerales bacterium]